MSSVDRIIQGLSTGMPDQAGDGSGGGASLADRMAFHHVPGVSLVVIEDCEPVLAKGYGSTLAGSDRFVTTATIFQAASVTKTLTSMLTLHFAGQGAFDLDADINQYLHSWKIPQNEFTSQAPVTLRHVLSQRAGFPTSNYGYDEHAAPPTLVDVLRGRHPAENEPAEVGFIPGSAWQYSNIGYDVVQLLLEDCLGKSFEAIAQEVVFRPLGMKDSTLDYPLPEEVRMREALPHDGQSVPGKPWMHPSALAHGGLMTTPGDLAVLVIELMQAWQGESTRLLKPEMARLMLTPACHLDPSLTGGLEGEAGLGVLLRGQGQEISFCHPGYNAPGAACWLEGYPGQGRGAIIMTNGANGLKLTFEILSALQLIWSH